MFLWRIDENYHQIPPLSVPQDYSTFHFSAIKHLPEDMTISEVEADSLRLSWRRPMVDLAQPINYQIQMLEPLMADWHPIATGVTDTTYKVTGLKPTRDYKFRVVPYADTRALPSTPVVGLTSSPGILEF